MYFCPQQAKTGVVMNIIGIICITLAINTWGKAMFHLDTFPAWANVTGVWTTSVITHRLCMPSSTRPRPVLGWQTPETRAKARDQTVSFMCCIAVWIVTESGGQFYWERVDNTWQYLYITMKRYLNESPWCLKLHGTNQMLSINLKPGNINYPIS